VLTTLPSWLTLPPFAKTAVALSTAFALGGLIGLERQWRQRTAGLRTNVLVAVGSAAFVDLGMRVSGADGGVRVISYVVSGIGFLGAGVIMKEGSQIRGINTAATLWASAAVGAFAGSAQFGEAALVAVFVLAGNTMLRPLADFINRKPISPETTEAVYRVHVVCKPEAVSEARDLLSEEVERHYPIRDVETLSEAEEQIELAATLVPTSADPEILDHITRLLEQHDSIESATWTVGTEV
jgi:putative Mg2+ transporter-C (MgtC) family protein